MNQRQFDNAIKAAALVAVRNTLANYEGKNPDDRIEYAGEDLTIKDIAEIAAFDRISDEINNINDAYPYDDWYLDYPTIDQIAKQVVGETIGKGGFYDAHL